MRSPLRSATQFAAGRSAAGDEVRASSPGSGGQQPDGPADQPVDDCPAEHSTWLGGTGEAGDDCPAEHHGAVDRGADAELVGVTYPPEMTASPSAHAA